MEAMSAARAIGQIAPSIMRPLAKADPALNFEVII